MCDAAREEGEGDAQDAVAEGDDVEGLCVCGSCESM